VAARRGSLLSYLRPFALIRRRAINQGLFGPSTAWKIVAVVVFGGKKLQEVVGRREQLVTVEKMEPGQTMILRTIKPLTRAEKKAGVTR